MKRLLAFALLLLTTDSFAQKKNYLYRICTEDSCEPGDPTGYVNQAGDTIVPPGKYYHCFTDTVKTFAAVLEKGKKGRCLAIDKKGKELYEIYWFDNGPDYIADGLFRIKVDGKIGYANEAGKIVIKPQFACTEPFEKGKARVTYDCELIPDDEHTAMVSDNWFYINKRGKKVSNPKG